MNSNIAPNVSCEVVLGLPRRVALLYVLLFTVAITAYLLLWPDAPIIAADSPGYMEVAQDLEDFHIDQLHGRTPGYPLLLLLTGSSHTPTRTLFIVSLLLHFASIWLLASTLYLCGLKEKYLILFGLWLLLPLYVERAGYVLTENLCQFTLVLGCVGLIFWVIHRKIGWVLVSSIAIAYSGLIRPTYQILVLAVILWLLLVPMFSNIKRREVVKAGVVLISWSALLVGGYALMNYLKFGYFGVTHYLGFHLTTRTIRYIEKLPDQYAVVRDILIKHRDAHLIRPHSSHTGYMSIWSAIPELKQATGLSEPQLSRYLLHINLLLIRKAPLHYLHEVFWALSTYCFPSVTELASMNSWTIQLIWVIVHFFTLSIFIAITIGLLGVFFYIICRRFLSLSQSFATQEVKSISMSILSFLLSGTVVIYTALVSCLIEEGEPRVRTPTDALLVFMIFVGAYMWFFLLYHPSVVIGVKKPTNLTLETETG